MAINDDIQCSDFLKRTLAHTNYLELHKVSEFEHMVYIFLEVQYLPRRWSQHHFQQCHEACQLHWPAQGCKLRSSPSSLHSWQRWAEDHSHKCLGIVQLDMVRYTSELLGGVDDIIDPHETHMAQTESNDPLRWCSRRRAAPHSKVARHGH
jgi:hypothetical protein